MDRCASHRKRNGSNNVLSNTDGAYERPVTMGWVSSEDTLSAGGGGGGEDTLTDPFAAFAVDFTIPPLEMSKSTAATATTARPLSARPRREYGNGWRNFEDYAYL